MGMVPHWAESDDSSFRAVNTRIETLNVKAGYELLVGRKRCLILASSWIMWHRHTNEPQLVGIEGTKTRVFAFAGLYDIWRKNGKRVSSCTILTCRANLFISSKNLSDRMPCILEPDAEDVWLDRSINDPKQVLHVLKPYRDEQMYTHAISKTINDVTKDGAYLLSVDKRDNNFGGKTVFHS